VNKDKWKILPFKISLIKGDERDRMADAKDEHHIFV